MVSGTVVGRAAVLLPLAAFSLFSLNNPGCAAKRDEIVRVVAVEQLNDYYDRLDYTPEAQAAGEITEVPRVRLERIPGRWSEGISVADKKSVFYRTILPLILEASERVLAERAQLVDLRAAIADGQEVAARDILWLADLAWRYGVRQRDPPASGAERLIHLG
jgi:Bax protein